MLDRTRRIGLGLEPLEPRNVPAAAANLAGGVLTVVGDAARDNIKVLLDGPANQIVVRDFVTEIGRFDRAAVTDILIVGGGGRNILTIDEAITQPATLLGGIDDDILKGGGGNTILLGGAGDDKLTAGLGTTTFDGGDGQDLLFGVKPVDAVVADAADRICLAIDNTAPPAPMVPFLDANTVGVALQRAAAATASEDAIIAIVDRNGRILGVRVEAGVNAALQADPAALAFAIDGAVAKARTGAFFANDQGPLTSRTVQFISQTTMTQREIESNPSIQDPNSTIAGPGFVAPIGIKSQFPPNVQYTPQVDLFAIEHTNRDSSFFNGVERPNRFDIAALAPGQQLFAPDSYAVVTGQNDDAIGRGIATLPGGAPIYIVDGNSIPILVGGIGVFFPGATGYANEENSSLSSDYDPTMLDRSYEAEYIAFAAGGGAPGLGLANRIGAINGVQAVNDNDTIPEPGEIFLNVNTERQRIDLVGITLDIVGPGGTAGPGNLLTFASSLAGVNQGDPNSGVNVPVNAMGQTLLDGMYVSEGYIVEPQDGVGITAAEVRRIIEDGIAQADVTRAAIRLPLNSSARMVFAVSDLEGNIVGLFRMHDATVFSIDVAVAKARNVAYYSSQRLQAIDQLPGIAIGTALTNRSFRYVSLPRFPEGIVGTPPGPFSILNDGGVDPITGLNVGAPLPKSAYVSVQGFDAFNPGTNFRDPAFRDKQNGIVFFPGSEPLYRDGALIGGFGVSGDGVDQDDVVTVAGAGILAAPDGLHIDNFFVNGIRVPYHKFNRNPEGGLT